MTQPTPTLPPDGPEPPDAPDWRAIVIGTLTALTTLLVLVLLLVRSSGDGADVVTDDRTTTTVSTTSIAPTTSSSSTTTSSTTTTTSPTTSAPPATIPGSPSTSTTTSSTTTGPPPTIALARCTGRTGPGRPEPVAEVFYDAWTIRDRTCAEQVATEEAIEDLFVYDGSDADWTFVGCEDTSAAEDRLADCRFDYRGGSATFGLHHDVVDGWEVTTVTFTVDDDSAG